MASLPKKLCCATNTEHIADDNKINETRWCELMAHTSNSHIFGPEINTTRFGWRLLSLFASADTSTFCAKPFPFYPPASLALVNHEPPHRHTYTIFESCTRCVIAAQERSLPLKYHTDTRYNCIAHENYDGINVMFVWYIQNLINIVIILIIYD